MHGFRLKKFHTTRSVSCSVFPDLPWYRWWLRNQLSIQPRSLFDCLSEFDPGNEDNLNKIFLPLHHKIADLIASSDTLTIDKVVGLLLDDGSIDAGNDYQNLGSAVSLVFAIIGWQTMLYRPDILSCPKDQLCIVDEMDGHHGESHMSLKQDCIASSKHLADFLLGFGLMLPPSNYHVLADAEEIKTYDRLKTVDPSTLNAFLLTSIGGVTIKWTDSLACHLELDKDSRVLYIFRYPSFCWSNREATKSVLLSCASATPGNSHWSTMQDIHQLMEEVVLSYRLLFAQSVRSRRLFQKLSPFENLPFGARDDLLASLCISKDFNLPPGVIQRDAYELARDFSHLRTRLMHLSIHLNERKPRSWTELWLDNRDSASWLTFWAVLIIGGIGLLLAFIQVALQVVQVAYQFQHPNQ
ncbi:hypothetical protein GGR57DRAFT_461285 [Xylariaceae sp. FL1272]|nr:hypothetical protein GGR57DRAFT_461285 [Xylariaceae sp. FL1272]